MKTGREIVAESADEATPETSPTANARHGFVEEIVFTVTVFCGALTAGGYLLSDLHLFGSVPGWVGVWAVALVLLFLVIRTAPDLGPSLRATLRAVVHEVSQSRVLRVACGASVVTLAASFLLGLCAAPSNWDSLTYHLARVSYYVQSGSLDNFGANNWTQTAHGRVSAILQAALMVPAGMIDRFHFLLQWCALILLALIIASLARTFGASRRAALFAAVMSTLCTNAILESSTAQNDLLLAAFTGAGLVGWFGFMRSGSWRCLTGGALGPALALGMKASILTIAPTFLLTVAGVSWASAALRLRATHRFPLLLGATAIAIGLIIFPAGYVKNFRTYGDWLGPAIVRQEVFVDSNSLANRLHVALLNGVRFCSDALCFDGLPESWGGAAGGQLKAAVGRKLATVGLDAESDVGVRIVANFSYSRPRKMDENFAWFGLLGPLLLLPATISTLVTGSRELRFMALGVVLFFVTTCVAGQYDPWRGRQMLYALPFAGPCVAGFLMQTQVRGRRWVDGILILGAGAAVIAALFRSPDPIIPQKNLPAFWQRDRLAQMTLNSAEYPALQRFEQIVERDAVVALALLPDSPEYVFFGRHSTRWLRPVAGGLPRETWKGFATWLVYDERLDVVARPDDISLGAHWWLRKLEVPGESAATTTVAP